MYEGTWGIPYTDVRVYEYTIYNIRIYASQAWSKWTGSVNILFFFFILEYRLIVLAELLTNPY